MRYSISGDNIPPENKLKLILPDELKTFVDRRDGAAKFAETLPEVFPPEAVFQVFGEEKHPNQVAWENVGSYYLQKGRPHEALPIYFELYQQMLRAQDQLGKRGHKGVPLVWMHECYRSMGSPVLAKRYLMLTLCEDSISECGSIAPDTSGVYFRLVWRHGLPDQELNRYAAQTNSIWQIHQADSFYPEWILQQLDQDWMTEIPAPQEAGIYAVNPVYVGHILSLLGEGTGQAMELLAEYILSCMPGCRTTRRERTHSTDYDIVCSI